MVAVGARRPKIAYECRPRDCGSLGSAAGNQTSDAPGNRKRGGMTPTTVAGRPLTAMLDPTTFGSPLSRCRQNASLTMTTPAAPGRSSSGRKPRPIAGAVPSVANAFADTGEPETIDGSNDLPVTVV